MTPSELTTRVTRDACVLGAALTVPAACLAGVDGAVGAVAGAGIAAANFRWLASRATAAGGTGSATRSLWSLAATLRLAVLAGAVGVVLASGHAHPLALVAGLSVLPVAVIGHGLRGAREEG